MSLALEWKGTAHTIPPVRGREGRDRIAAEPRGRAGAAEGRRLRLTFVCFIAVAVFVCGLFILSICLHVMVVQNEMRAREVERQIELERRQHEAMRVEIASLESPARIEKMAVAQLGMVQVTQAEYLETPAYRAAKVQEEDGVPGKEGIISDATRGEQR